MAKKDVVDNLWNMFLPIVSEANFELCDVEFLKEGPNWYLRVYIDKEGGITIDDCELISRKVEALLDENDPITQAYILEVSSPGIDRALKKESDYEKYKGHVVDIKLYKAREKQKEFQGTLIGLKDGIISIGPVTEDGQCDFDEKDITTFEKVEIASCKLAVFF